ncbi:MAG: polymer-forming cytoskeletal protein [Gammaproteobacteria bacterium]|nr:polymer-forming cytoskeletal protein [Gammaproteobacteria bacterium]NIR85446.1 polymer-forming cytoskeletal protein [Gammaproteobacteria bacterium]NIR89497.1 polymer-forming cytoskeletal protein [Gammaproteobacteria bacterium]NIU06582.1 polymer-forming cytoskeletal protein [Gammaproteobacteria bacterium]NIV53465.1 polymer-forming cytoskeletal protein [Gammaproteobacteria bacterium]
MLRKPERKEPEHPQPHVEPQEPPPAPKPTREPAVIGPSISIKGEVTGDQDLLVQGAVEGTLKLTRGNSAVTVGKEGRVKANIHARVVEVEGRVEGDLHGDERVVLRRSATVVGNIYTPRIALEDGCKFRGSIEMDASSADTQKEERRSSAAAGSTPQASAQTKREETRRQSA